MSLETTLIWADALLSIAFMTSVWKDNIFCQIAQNIAIGAAVGHAILLALDTIYRTGITDLAKGNIIVLGGLIMGAFMLGRLTPYKWLARYPTQLLMCVGLGAMFGLSITSDMFGQIISTADGLINPKTTSDLVSAIVLFVGVATTLAFFLFTFPPFVLKQREKGPYGIVRRVGRVFMMASFGMTFAGEEIGYLTVFIGRLWLFFKTALGL